MYPTDARLDEVGPGVFELRDVSTNLDEPNFGAGAFDPVPFAVGEMTARTSAVPIAPGVDIEAGDEFTFEIALCDGAINTYVREALRDGQIGFVLASLHPAVGGPGGGFDGSYPFFHFSEGAGPPATLEIVFDVVGVTTCLGDLDGDGSTLLGDFSDLLLVLRPVGVRRDLRRLQRRRRGDAGRLRPVRQRLRLRGARDRTRATAIPDRRRPLGARVHARRAARRRAR